MDSRQYLFPPCRIGRQADVQSGFVGGHGHHDPQATDATSAAAPSRMRKSALIRVHSFQEFFIDVSQSSHGASGGSCSVFERSSL